MISQSDTSLLRTTIAQEPLTLLSKRELSEDFVITLNVGTPPQVIKVALDVGR
jgi:hypothetical protein